jgi:hypothetical protein
MWHREPQSSLVSAGVENLSLQASSWFHWTKSNINFVVAELTVEA